MSVFNRVGRKTFRSVLLAGFAAVLTMAFLPAMPVGAAGGPPGSQEISPGIWSTNLGNGDTYENACSFAVSPGTAYCNADQRIGSYSANGVAALAPYARNSTTTDPSGYGPSQLDSAYHINTALGAGKTVAIVDAGGDSTIASDLATYRSTFGLPACTNESLTGSILKSTFADASKCLFEQVSQNGLPTSLPKPVSGWNAEISLDVQMVSAICPQCNILLVEASSATLSSLGTAVNEAVALGATAVSNSYSGGDSSSDASYDSSYYNHPGVAIVAASGDSGYGVGYPASSRDVVAVGGTTLTEVTTAPTWSETAWSGAGAGCSSYEEAPTWQSGICTSPSGARAVADVSADANPNTGVATLVAGSWAVYGGTSVATPIISSLFTEASTTLGTAQSSYPANNLYNESSALYQVTSGSDGTCTTAPMCNAADSMSDGYNGPTGLGTPEGLDSLAAFTGPTTALSAPSAPVNPTAIGSTTTATISWVAPASYGSSAITGYNVYAGASVTATPLNGSTPVTDTSYTTTGTFTGSTQFTVVAVNVAGSSPGATATLVASTPPGAPAVSAKAGNASATLTITASSTPGTGTLVGYNVYAGASVTGTPLSGSTPTTSTSYSVMGLTNGTSYNYTVTEVSTAGSSPGTTVTVTPASAPNAPTSLTARAATTPTTGVQLTWLVPANGGSAITSYTLLEGTSSRTLSTTITVPTTDCTTKTCTYVDTATTRTSSTYYFDVAAVNAIGTGTASSTVSSKG